MKIVTSQAALQAHRTDDGAATRMLRSFRISPSPASVARQGKAFSALGADGRMARGTVVNGRWEVREIDGVKLPSEHPETQRIAAEISAAFAAG